MTYTAPERGYIQVFVPNASDEEVFFDQMVVEHIPQLTVQKNHYYPFGLELVGLNKKGKPEHRWKFQGQEEQKEFGLNWLSYGQREYDPVLGRFNRIDRFAEKYYDFNPYQYAANNPIRIIDIQGDSIYTVFTGRNKKEVPAIVQKMFNQEYGIKVGYNAKTKMLYYAGEVDFSENFNSKTGGKIKRS